MTCPNCAKETADQSTRCEHCGTALTAAASRDDDADTGKTGYMLKAAGGALLLIGALMFLSATAYGGGGTAGLAIVLFVAGLVTFFAGRVHVDAR